MPNFLKSYAFIQKTIQKNILFSLQEFSNMNFKKGFLAFALLISGLVYANDTHFYMSAGQLVPSNQGSVEVEMQEEIITIVLEPTYYEVSVDFYFFNYGKATDLEVGFPFFCAGWYGKGEISDFKCWTNGKETDYKDYPITKEWKDGTGLEKAYVRKIRFPSNDLTKTRISYKSKYGRSSPSYNIASYLYGTGSTWKDSIRKMTVRIVNHNFNSVPETIEMHGKQINESFYRINDTTMETVFYDVEPESISATFTIYCGRLLGDDGPRCLSLDDYFPCIVKLSPKALNWYSCEQLRYVRNAIYALHGYSFNTKELKEYFEKVGQDWYPKYEVNPKFSEKDFSDIEWYNIKLIYKEEQIRKEKMKNK